MTLARLGVSEQVKDTEVFENKHQDLLLYRFESAPIRQMPMMFEKLVVDGFMVAITPKDEKDRYYKASEKYYVVSVNLDYKYDHFDGGSNICSIGRMVFLVDKELPKSFDENKWAKPDMFIRKVEGLSI